MKRLLFFLIPLFVVTVLCACKKNDTANSSGPVTVQGNVTLTVSVMHHTWGVPAIPVYIKFNTTQWPGKDTTKYDIRQLADQEGVVTFTHLGPGNMVIYAAGFDPVFQAYVIGYGTFNITKEDANSTVNATVVVSEKF
jgi:hypothetical protein